MKLVDILNNTISTVMKEKKTVIIGNEIHFILDDNRRINVHFRTTKYADRYDAIQIVLYNKHTGPIETVMIPFESIFKTMEDMNHPYKIEKYIRKDRISFDWYWKPNASDIKAINNTIQNAIDLWL